MKRFLSVRHLLLLAMLVLSGTLVLVISQRYSRVQPTTAEAPAENADLSLAKIDYTETRDGKAYWRLLADKASYDLGSKQSRLNNVQFSFFGKEAGGTLSLQAEQGTWDEAAGELEVFGHVVVTSDQGYRFSTARLYYHQAKNLLWTDDEVQLNSKQLEIQGIGMRVMVEQRRFKILDRVRSRWMPVQHKEDKG